MKACQFVRAVGGSLPGIGDIRLWGGTTSAHCWVAWQQADFASAAKLASDMVRVGQDAGDPNVTSWGRNGLGLLALTVGPLDEAASHLSIGLRHIARISSFSRARP